MAEKRVTEGSPWGDVLGGALHELKATYRAEVKRFAEALRPRFETGQLRGYTDEDEEREGHLKTKEEAATVIPFRELEQLCAQHFGVGISTEDEASTQRELIATGVILAASPSAEATASGDWVHPGYWASSAVCWDVLLYARERRWYVPAPDEEMNAAIRARG